MAAKGFVGSTMAYSSMSVGRSLRPKSGGRRSLLLAFIFGIGAPSVSDGRGLPCRALNGLKETGIKNAVELLKLLIKRRGLGDVT